MTSYPFTASGRATWDVTGAISVLFDTGEQIAVTAISGTVQATAVSGGPTSYEVDAWIPDNADLSTFYGQDYDAFGGALHWPFAGGSVALPGGTTRAQVRCYPRGSPGFPVSSSPPAVMDISITGTWEGTAGTGVVPVVACAYGTRAKIGTTAAAWITVGLIDVMLGELGGAWVWLAPFLTGVSNAYLNVGALCGSPPPSWPAGVTLDTLATQPLDTLLQCLQYVAWPHFCECVPATGILPPAIPFVQTPPIQVIGTPPPLRLLCDGTDLCVMLDEIFQAILAHGARLQSIGQQVDLMQRQGVPFAYLEGLSHSALSGSGDFAIAGLIGLSVTFTTLPGSYPAIPGDPDTYHQIGKVSLGTAAGWRRSWAPTHSPYIILPISGAFTRVGYSFPPGIVATITELVRER